MGNSSFTFPTVSQNKAKKRQHSYSEIFLTQSKIYAVYT